MFARLWDRFTSNLDGTLVLLAVVVLTLGLFTLYSASYDNPGRFNAQFANIAVAFVAMWVAAQIPPQTLMRFAVPIFARRPRAPARGRALRRGGERRAALAARRRGHGSSPPR